MHPALLADPVRRRLALYSLAAVIISKRLDIVIVICSNMVRNRILWKADTSPPKLYADILLAAMLAIFLIGSIRI